MAHIVVLGAGVGGIPMAYELRDLLGKEHEITVVSKADFFQFTPSNPWVAVSWRKKDDITVSLPECFARKGIRFIHAAADKVVPEDNALELANGQTLAYDYLVIATGPELAFDEIAGLGPDGFTSSICDVDHAVTSSAKWEEFCANPGPIVVGAVQGASCFGPAYEFAMILDTDLRKRKIRDKVPMTFVTSEPYIGHLGLGGVGDTKGLLESALRDKHINWVTNAKIDKITRDKVFVTEVNEDKSDKKKHELDFGYAMFLPGFRGIPAVRDVDGLSNPRGFILADKHQRNPTHKNIFSVGVCIAIPPVEETPVPVGVPKTGYMIESMVTATAHNIKEVLEGKEPTHEATWNAICLADFGDSGVAFVAMPQIPPRNVNWSAHGKWVHLAKIAFEKYFLRKIRKGASEPIYEKQILKLMGIGKVKDKKTG